MKIVDDHCKYLTGHLNTGDDDVDNIADGCRQQPPSRDDRLHRIRCLVQHKIKILNCKNKV